MEYPDTLASIENFALTLQEQGREDEANELLALLDCSDAEVDE